MGEIKSMKRVNCLNCTFVNSVAARICESCQKSLIIDNYDLTDLYKTFDELLVPLAEALRESSIEDTTAEDLLSGEVYSVLMSLANYERNISGNEAKLIREVRYNLNHDISLDLDIPTLRDGLQDNFKQLPKLNVFDRQNLCLAVISAHDALAGTDYTSKIKAMFLCFASAVLESDANMTGHDYEALNKFRRYLDSHGHSAQTAIDSHTPHTPTFLGHINGGTMSSKCARCGFSRAEGHAIVCPQCKALLVVDNYGLSDFYSSYVSLSQVVDVALKQSSENKYTGADVLRGDLLKTALYMAAIDKQISAVEGAMLWEIFRNLIGKGDPNLSARAARDFWQQQRDENLMYQNALDGLYPSLSLLLVYDQSFATDHATKAKALIFRLANLVVKANNRITSKEREALSGLTAYLEAHTAHGLNPPPGAPSKDIQASTPTATSTLDGPVRSTEDLFAELNQLVGLNAVKKEVTDLVNFLKIQKLRQDRGMKVSPVSRHLVFSGNPGTGKTMVARMLSQIYRSLGILTKGHLVETDRAGLVAGYLGQTALKIQEVVKSAIGGTLFIDEAYTLTPSQRDEFGQEAIGTLIKLMEDHRNDLVVVVAGYTKKMDEFLSFNPGMHSRFNRFLEFPDYSPNELVLIFKSFCSKGGYHLTPKAEDELLKLFEHEYKVRNEKFGNGRLARNIFQKTIHNQASRVIALPHVTDKILSENRTQRSP